MCLWGLDFKIGGGVGLTISGEELSSQRRLDYQGLQYFSANVFFL